MADQTKRILYMQDSGVLAVICPGLKETRTVEEIAKKDVPTGKKYNGFVVTDKPPVTTNSMSHQVLPWPLKYSSNNHVAARQKKIALMSIITAL